MEPENDARQRLAEAMNRRRTQLRLKWQDVAVRAGISVPTLKRIRGGPGPITDWAAHGLEKALGWPDGAVARILADEDVSLEQAGGAESVKYRDPGLQAIWDAPGLTEMERRLAIGAVQAWRSQGGDAGTGRPSRRADIA